MSKTIKKSTLHGILIGLFLILSGIFFMQCTQKEDSQISEEEWAALPANGPYLSSYEHIVCNSEATESELYAAKEFQRLFKGFTGKELTIATSSSESEKVILIGNDAATTAGLKVNTKEMGEEGFKIEIAGDKLAIFGGRPRGTLYGVYEFFEQYCGVRFLTYDHTFYPSEGKDNNFRIKGHDYSYIPPFVYRYSYYGETNRNPEFAAQLRTNKIRGSEKLGGTTRYNNARHSVADLVPPEIYGKEHPEYFALVNGKRLLSGFGGGPQLCMTNPDVLEIVVEAILEAIKKNPTQKNFSVAQEDNGNYCTCEYCSAIDEREETHIGATLSLVNAVAERIEETHPDVLISTFAYRYTRKPPKTIRARDNVFIHLCSIECCNFHAVNDSSCTLNQEFCDDMDRWKEKTKNIFIWHYNTNFRAYLLPYPNLRSIGNSIEYFANNNGKGVFMQAAGNGFSTELSDLRNYVISRCLWKPGRDSWKEAMNFCRMHYAESAQPIIDYLTYYHNLIEKEGKHPICYATEASLCLNPTSVRRIDEYFSEALDLAQAEDVRLRVEKASLCVYRAKLSMATMKLNYKDGVCTPYWEGSDENLLKRYAELCAKYKVNSESEYKRINPYLNNMRKLYAGMPAVRLENDKWRVLILPESNAKLIEMTYKPTDRDVIKPARSLERFRYEEWVRQGDGPTGDGVLAYEVIRKSPTETVLALTAKDGARIERTISLIGDAINFETSLKAKEARAFDFLVHPEYDAGSGSDNPEELSIYVKSNKWIQSNKGWVNAKPSNDAQRVLVKEGLKGGAYAFYNHKAGFGVEQRFKPGAFEDLTHYWNPERGQVNLGMISTLKMLKAGEKASFAYEVRYLDKAPTKR